MRKDWKYFLVSFFLTLFLCGAVTMAVRVESVCSGFDGAQTGSMLVFSHDEEELQVTLFAQEKRIPLSGLAKGRALWWQMYPIFPYPVKVGETLREYLVSRLEAPPELLPEPARDPVIPEKSGQIPNYPPLFLPEELPSGTMQE